MKNSKNLKILLLTDRLSLGGAETHILSLYNELCALGHSVTVISSGGALSDRLRHVRLDLASHSPLTLLRGYFALRSLVLREGFDLIHAHARLPALVASLVARQLRIPLVTTVHARFRLCGLRRVLSSWGFRSVAVSEDLREYLIKNYNISAEAVTVIENGVDFTKKAKHSKKNHSPTVLFLSRLDSDCSLCAELLCKIAPRLCESYKDVKILIGGGGERLERIKSLANNANRIAGREAVRAVGEVCDVPEFLARGDIFVGVSRCALEAISASLPVIVAGNEGFFGRLTPNNFSLSLATNFCARGESKPNEDLLFSALCDALNDMQSAKQDAQEVNKKAKELLDISLIAPRYEELYRRAIADYKAAQKKHAETLLVGYYGYSNLGDNALLRSAIKRARLEFCESVGALTRAPKKCSRDFAIPCFSRRSPISVFLHIYRCKRLVFGGGTLFQDLTSKRSLIYYLVILKLALALKKDVLLYANGIGNIKSASLRTSLIRSLSKCSYIGVRDEYSYRFLRSALPKSTLVILENDLSLAIKPSAPPRADYLIYHALKSKNKSNKNEKSEAKRDFFIVCPHSNASRFDRFELDIAIRKQKNKGLTPIFVPCSPDDVDISNSFKRKYGGGMLQSLTFSDLLALILRSHYVISMRYHPLLAARALRIPFLAIGDDIKLKEFCN